MIHREWTQKWMRMEVFGCRIDGRLWRSLEMCSKKMMCDLRAKDVEHCMKWTKTLQWIHTDQYVISIWCQSRVIPVCSAVSGLLWRWWIWYGQFFKPGWYSEPRHTISETLEQCCKHMCSCRLLWLLFSVIFMSLYMLFSCPTRLPGTLLKVLQLHIGVNAGGV